MKILENGEKRDFGFEAFFTVEPEGTSVPEAYENAVIFAVRATLLYESVQADCTVDVTFCDGPFIRSLNAEYRDKDSETDVLSFPLYERDEVVPCADCVELPLGDIVINLDRAAEQAKEIGHSTLREVAFLAVHSTLHLLGYDHELSEADDEDMCRRQREIMEKLTKILQKEEKAL